MTPRSAPMDSLKIKRLYYIHGFASGRSSGTYQKIRERFPFAEILSFDSAKPYPENLKSLAAQIDGGGTSCFVGTSLGGFYAMELSALDKNCIGRILINPGLMPKSSLKKFVGVCPNFETGADFEFTNEACDSYPEKPGEEAFLKKIPTIALLAKNDELLDYRLAEQMLKDCADIRYISGGHRLEDCGALFEALNEIAAAL